MDLQFGDVEVTALIPLSNRASETLRKHPRVKDEKAVKIIRSLQLETKKYDKLITHECVIARTIMFDQAVSRLVEKYPNAVCINMGCGMDDRFTRVDNKQIIWFDVDLPDSIEVRRKIYSDTERRKMISANVLETNWIKAIRQTVGEQPVIVIAEGLLMYFSKEENQTILQNLTNYFERGFLVAEMMRPSMMDEKKHDTVKYTKVKFGWGTKSGKEFEQLEPRMKLVSENSFAEQMRKSTLISRVIGLVSDKINNRLAIFKWMINT